jgi:hypothetical protein
MNKLTQIKSQLKKQAIFCGVALTVSVALMIVIGGMQETAETEKTNAESTLSSTKGNVASAMQQVDNTDKAKKQFVEIQAVRSNDIYTLDTDALKVLITTLRDELRLATGVKLTLSNEMVESKPAFSSLYYPVVARPDNSITFGAMSDLHSFAFLDALATRAPGFIRFTSLSLTRKSTINAETLTQMAQGGIPEIVAGDVHFAWIGIDIEPQKESDAAAGAAPQASAAGGAAGAMP